MAFWVGGIFKEIELLQLLDSEWENYYCGERMGIWRRKRKGRGRGGNYFPPGWSFFSTITLLTTFRSAGKDPKILFFFFF